MEDSVNERDSIEIQATSVNSAQGQEGMTPEQHKLKELLRKVTSGTPLSVEESTFIKDTYKSLQREYESVIEDSSEDEVKVMAIRSAMDSLHAKRISGPEFVSEVIYSIHALKDKRKRDRMLRSEIAYRMALASYFYEHVRAIKKMRSDTPATSEFLFQVNELNSSMNDYRKLKANQVRRSEAA